tara:strand:- start:687 stop:1031 length:345 start_codon:yes stop_codon:yes gene_type:complete
MSNQDFKNRRKNSFPNVFWKGDTLYTKGRFGKGIKPGDYIPEGHESLPTERDGKPVSQQRFSEVSVDKKTGKEYTVYNDPNKWAIEDILLKKDVEKLKKINPEAYEYYMSQQNN